MPPQPVSVTKVGLTTTTTTTTTPSDSIGLDTKPEPAKNSDGKVLRAGSLGGLKLYKPSELTEYVNMLVYGEPGIGKTKLGGSACEVDMMSPVVVINLEQGAKTLRGSYPDTDQIEVLNPRTFGQVQRIFDDLNNRRGAGFKTVIVDNATEAQKVGIEYIFDQDKPSTDFTEFMDASWGNGSWNRSSDQMRKMIRYFRTLPMNTIWIAWSKDYSKSVNTERWGPAFSKSLAGEVPGMFDSVLYYHWKMVTDPASKKQSNNRVLETQGSNKWVAKDRDGGHPLPATIVNPTMTKLCRAWGLV